MINVRTNGKLYISGEYQILKTAGNALVYGIDKYIEFSINESSQYSYENGDHINWSFSYDNKILTFANNNDNEIVKKSFEVIFEYLEHIKIKPTPFKIYIVTELENNDGQKYGFGSSSAIISGIIKTVATYFKVELSNMLLFKLSVIAQKNSNTLTSGGDIAASIFGTTILYQRYKVEWLVKKHSLKTLIDKKWPKLKIVPFNTKLNFAAIWTKKSYKTGDISIEISVKDYKQAKKIVNKMYISLIDNNYLDLKNDIKDYQKWMENVLTSENLMTKELTKTLKILNKFYLAGKVSGAGGGDSVIFLYPEGYNFTELKKELENHNLELIMLKETK